MSSKPAEQVQEVIPEVLFDPSTKKRYQRGRFLGKVYIVIINLIVFQQLRNCHFAHRVALQNVLN
jgi:hypothetical protein